MRPEIFMFNVNILEDVIINRQLIVIKKFLI